MHSNRIIEILFLTALTLSALSCREPSIRENFVKSSKISGDGRYHFDVDFSDSLALYDISFYSKLDEVTSTVSFPVTVHWKSPSGWSFSERVYWNPTQEVVQYRTDIAPRELGTWDLSVYIGEYPPLCGLGIITERKDGTR